MDNLLPIEWAAGIAKRMRNCFGAKFDKQWQGQTRDELLEAIQDILSGLTAEELARGCETMKSKTFCPSLSEFRSWCRPVDAINAVWIGGSTAWAVAVASQREENTIIWTHENQAAWQSVQSLIGIGDKFNASKAFIEKYEALVEIAKAENREPVYITSLGTDTAHRIAATEEAKQSGLIASVPIEVSHLIENKHPLSDISKEKIAEMREKLGMTAKPIDKTQEIVERKAQMIETLKARHIDPFDDRDEYVELCNRNIDLPYASTNLRSVGA